MSDEKTKQTRRTVAEFYEETLVILRSFPDADREVIADLEQRIAASRERTAALAKAARGES